MTKAEASVEERLAMFERGELRVPEMPHRNVRCSMRARDRSIRATAATTDGSAAKPHLRSAPQRPGTGSP